MDYEEWLENLKVGDEVCYSARYHGYIIETIEKITPTGLIKTKQHTYKNGRCKSSDWEHYTIEPITQKVIDNLRERELYRKIKNFNFDKLTLEQLEKVYAVIKDFD